MVALGMFRQIVRYIVSKMDIIRWYHKIAPSELNLNYLHLNETFVEVRDRVSSMCYK